MEIQIHSRNVDLNPEAHAYIQKKFDRLQRHMRHMSDAKIEVSWTERAFPRRQGHGPDDAHRRRLHAARPGKRRQPVRRRGRRDRRSGPPDKTAQGPHTTGARRPAKQRGRAVAQDDVFADADFDADERDEELYEELGRVVRTKRFAMKPMSVEDAAMQMELLSHDFFLFYNIATDEYNVVYRRSDGDYGVIEPELA